MSPGPSAKRRTTCCAAAGLALPIVIVERFFFPPHLPFFFLWIVFFNQTTTTTTSVGAKKKKSDADSLMLFFGFFNIFLFLGFFFFFIVRSRAMELHSLQEALKVEIQSHQKLLSQMKQDPQNCDLKKEIHEKQCRIASLNEKQRLAVRNCALAVGSAVKPGIHQNLALSLLPSKAPANMVTAHLNGQKEPPQRVPINLQATNKLLLGSGALSLSTGRRIPEGMHTQTLGNPSTVPIKVPQISSLHRLAGHGSTVLPQVRPKTLIPDSLPISSCRDQLSKQPPTFQKGTVVCVKNPSPALPTANNTVSHIQTQNGLSQSNDESKPISSALSSAGVAYAIISTSSSNVTPVNPSTVSLTSDGLKGQPFLTGTDSKVIIIQPQNQTHPENNVEIKQEPGRQSEETDHGVTPTKKKKEENAEKIAFMVALGLVTTEHLEEIQNKRQERKRRSTANPTYSGFLEPERKRFASNYLYNPMFLTARANEEPYWKDEITHDSYCTVCKRGSNLQPCSICPKAYHLNCVDPPLKSSPKGIWVCPKCQLKVFKKDSDVPWRGTLSIPHSYVTHKTVKEEEKRKLLKRGDELKNEHRQLQDKEQLLSGAMKKCLERKSSLLAQQKGTQSSLERLKNLIRLIQNEQMIQVTMTTTTTSSLLAVPWIKPASASAAMHQALQQSQSNN